MTSRTFAGRVAAAGAALTLTALAAAPAQAAGYRYWSFWESDGGKPWAYATLGPATARPADGATIGFRFAVSEGTSDTSTPTPAPDFAKICGDVAEKSGTKRIAVVVDFGGPKDAPPGETPPAETVRLGCAQVPESGSGAEALAAVAKPLRYNDAAMLCAIAGYPSKGCGEQVAEAPDTTATPSGSPASASGAKPVDGGPSFGVLAGGAAVLALGGAAIWKARRRG
ncbi:SCO2322 family protein [Streptomyces sp. NPDC020807]|uniref:SCO2322 family protein n=1 Tax=Streptomyces sp. NPDC020807 TaxID=3155119 RepID=UPI0033D4F767